MFFQLAEGQEELPADSSKDVLNSFVLCLVQLVRLNPGDATSVKALEILFKYMKNDNQVFKSFFPSEDLIRKMSIDKFIQSKNKEEQELGLDFSTFLLRYHQRLTHEAFSDDQRVISRIRRN